VVRVRRIRLSELACGAPLRQLGWANWIESIALWRAGIRVLDGIFNRAGEPGAEWCAEASVDPTAALRESLLHGI